MITHFPTASTALIQLRDGDYNLSQLISKVDGAVRDQGSIDGSTEEQVVRKSGEGFQEEGETHTHPRHLLRFQVLCH